MNDDGDNDHGNDDNDDYSDGDDDDDDDDDDDYSDSDDDDDNDEYSDDDYDDDGDDDDDHDGDDGGDGPTVVALTVQQPVWYTSMSCGVVCILPQHSYMTLITQQLVQLANSKNSHTSTAYSGFEQTSCVCRCVHGHPLSTQMRKLKLDHSPIWYVPCVK